MKKKETPVDYVDLPPEARHTWNGLHRWLEGRRGRGVPVDGSGKELHVCDEGCKLHDSNE